MQFPIIGMIMCGVQKVFSGYRSYLFESQDVVVILKKVVADQIKRFSPKPVLIKIISLDLP